MPKNKWRDFIMNKNDDVFKEFLNQAANSAALGVAKLGVENAKEFLPLVADFTRSMYEEMKKKGFTDQQAFQFSSEYVMRSFSQK